MFPDVNNFLFKERILVWIIIGYNLDSSRRTIRRSFRWIALSLVGALMVSVFTYKLNAEFASAKLMQQPSIVLPHHSQSSKREDQL